MKSSLCYFCYCLLSLSFKFTNTISSISVKYAKFQNERLPLQKLECLDETECHVQIFQYYVMRNSLNIEHYLSTFCECDQNGFCPSLRQKMAASCIMCRCTGKCWNYFYMNKVWLRNTLFWSVWRLAYIILPLLCIKFSVCSVFQEAFDAFKNCKQKGQTKH